MIQAYRVPANPQVPFLPSFWPRLLRAGPWQQRLARVPCRHERQTDKDPGACFQGPGTVEHSVGGYWRALCRSGRWS